MERRITQLQHQLQDRDIDVAVLNHPPDVYYFAGTGTQATLVVPADEDPVLLVRINLSRAKRDATVQTVRQSSGRDSVVEALDSFDECSTVGMATDVVPASLVDGLRSALGDDTDIVNVSSAIHDVRQTKGLTEIEAIEEAARISKRCLEAVPEIAEPGLTEGELQAELEKIKRQHSAEPEMVNRGWNMWNNFGIVASGPNTAEISGFWVTITGEGMHAGRPFGASDRELQKRDVLVVDHGTLVEGYHSDEARTYVVGDDRSEVESDVEILFECLDEAVDAVEPGVPVSEPYERALEIATSYGKEEEFMALGQYGVSYLGHGVGLEIDELPLVAAHSDQVFEPGMTIALEPKFVYPGEWGATVEDTVLVTEDGARRLTGTRRELIRC